MDESVPVFEHSTQLTALANVAHLRCRATLQDVDRQGAKLTAEQAADLRKLLAAVTPKSSKS